MSLIAFLGNNFVCIFCTFGEDSRDAGVHVTTKLFPPSAAGGAVAQLNGDEPRDATHKGKPGCAYENDTPHTSSEIFLLQIYLKRSQL